MCYRSNTPKRSPIKEKIMNENNETKKKLGSLNEWPIKRVAISDLRPYERNPRTISPQAFERLKNKIAEVGFNVPLIATHDLRLIGGHQRLRALTEMGMTEINVSVAPYEMTDKQFKAAVINDNISDGEWDIDILEEDFETYELEAFGIEKNIVQRLNKKALPDKADDEMPLPAVAITQLGDTWILDNHRLRCGDATNSDDVKALLNGAIPHLMVTDPPYGVEYDASWRDRAGINLAHQKIATGKVQNDDRADWREAWALFPGDVAYVWHGSLHAPLVGESLVACGFDIRAQIVWAKKNLVMGRGHYRWQHEPCWYAVREGGTGHWQGDRKQSTLWEIANMHATQGNVDDGKTNHSTQKPVECMKRPIENNSAAGDAIYEPFSGSGSTIIAAEITGRVCYAMELDPLYVDMAVKRWCAFTGRIATRESDGLLFGVAEV